MLGESSAEVERSTVLARLLMALKLILKRQTATPDEPPLVERAVKAEEVITIGSDPAATLAIKDSRLAPEHITIIQEGDRWTLFSHAPDTHINGESVLPKSPRPVKIGDRIELLDFVILLLSEEPGGKDEQTVTVLNDRDEQTTMPGAAEKPGSFATIISSLRDEEDNFYFVIHQRDATTERVLIQNAEMLIGWDESGESITCDPLKVVVVRALARKEWSGVVVEPRGRNAISVNGEILDQPRRLRNGDRLVLLPPNEATAAAQNCYIIFHEPAALAVLDSILPQELPPPVNPLALSASDAASPNPSEIAANGAVAGAAPVLQRRFFGYFTLTEIIIMVIGTLLAAVVIFLILEYS